MNHFYETALLADLARDRQPDLAPARRRGLMAVLLWCVNLLLRPRNWPQEPWR